MTFDATLVGSGLVGWQFLQNTMETQVEMLENSASVASDLDYFRENISKVETPEDLVSDYRLLSVTLTAFGMSDQIEYKALLQKVLEEGAEDEDSLANRLSSTDSRFLALSEAFDFTPISNIGTSQDGFSDNILYKFDINAELEIEALEVEFSASLAAYESEGVTDEELEQRRIFYENEIISKQEKNLEYANYFREEISKISTPAELIVDRKLLEVSLTAFSIQDRSNSLVLLQNVLTDGGIEGNSLARVIGDKNLIEFAESFGFYNEDTLGIHSESFIDDIVEDYVTYQFEESVGNQSEDLRYALNFSRAIPEMAIGDGSSDTRWYQVLSNESLREVFQTALGLPSEFVYIDIDQQLEQIKEKASTRFGVSDFDDFSNEELVEEVVSSYLLINQSLNGSNLLGSDQIILTLLGAYSS